MKLLWCHSRFVPTEHNICCIADMFRRNKFTSVDVPPGISTHMCKSSDPCKCSASGTVVKSLNSKAASLFIG